MCRSLPALVLALGLGSGAGCGSSGSGVRIIPGGDGGGGDAASTPSDLAGMPPADMAMAPVDLATPVDFTTPVDLTTPPDFTSVGGTCAAGRYTGPLNVNAGGMALTGTVSLTLGQAVNGVLPVLVGNMTATDGLAITATATVTGNLDCGNKRLTGPLKNGMVNVGGMNLAFSGMVGADYNTQNRTFTNGTLTIDLLAGMGTWTATYLGP